MGLVYICHYQGHIVILIKFTAVHCIMPLNNLHLHAHLADAFVQSDFLIHTLMVVAAMQGADRTSRAVWAQYLAQGDFDADQGNQTSDLMIARHWLYLLRHRCPSLNVNTFNYI